MTYASSSEAGPGSLPPRDSLEPRDAVFYSITRKTPVLDIEVFFATYLNAQRGRPVDIDLDLTGEAASHTLQDALIIQLVETLLRRDVSLRIKFEDIEFWPSMKDWNKIIADNRLVVVSLFHLSSHYDNLTLLAKDKSALAYARDVAFAIRHRIRRNDGIAERTEKWDRSMTVWSLDWELQSPRYFADAIEEKNSERFNNKLSRLRSYLEPPRARVARSKTVEVDSDAKNFNTYVFELYDSVPAAIDRRRSQIAVGGQDGLGEELFLSELGEFPSQLSQGSIFCRGGAPAPFVFASVASALQRMRVAPRNSLRRDEYPLAPVLDWTEIFQHTFTEGMVRACIVRAAKKSELYPLRPPSRREMSQLVHRVVFSPDPKDRVVALEILLACSIGKIPVPMFDEGDLAKFDARDIRALFSFLVRSVDEGSSLAS